MVGPYRNNTPSILLGSALGIKEGLEPWFDTDSAISITPGRSAVAVIEVSLLGSGIIEVTLDGTNYTQLNSGIAINERKLTAITFTIINGDTVNLRSVGRVTLERAVLSLVK